MNAVAYHYGVETVGVDVCEPAIERARAIAKRLGLAHLVRYDCADLFRIDGLQLNATNQFLIVNSSGVLPHTFQEVYEWLADCGFLCVATSINKFQPVQDWRKLFEEEKTMAALSYQRNYKEQRYFPGFFVVLAQKLNGS